ncbi:hypothetical protein QNK12_29245 [Neobacillus cucumis]|nr:hypothetical protein QNK12_29245 [Neobacillus cucumis]
MEKGIICSNCQYSNQIVELNCRNCGHSLETISRLKYRSEQKGQSNPLHDVKSSIGEWGIASRVAVLIGLGWLIYKCRILLFLTLFALFSGLLELLSSLGFIGPQIQDHVYFLQNAQATNLMSNYFVVFSITGFVDKFFPELFPGLFQYSEKVRTNIPSFPFSGLIKIVLIFVELLSKIIWIFSSSVIRFITSLFSFIFVIIYKFSIPIFSFIIRVLDSLNISLDKTTNKMYDKSKRIER